MTNAQSIDEKARLHNLAQAAHCAAQGKIGSGFDIAAATYGSCIYRRFSPSTLEGLGGLGAKGFSTRLKSVVENADSLHQWDVGIDKDFAASMPRGLRLVMCDVDCGSETVGMVQNILSWRKEKPEQAKLLWETLHQGNQDLATELHRLAQKEDDSVEAYDNLRTILLTIRSLIREMSALSGVPVEPKSQTDLIDACCRLPGVVGGVVPGAGGFDAIALMVENTGEVIDSLQNCLKDYGAGIDHGQESKPSRVRLLGVQQDDEGLRQEHPLQYKGWLR